MLTRLKNILIDTLVGILKGLSLRQAYKNAKFYNEPEN